jgi:hypothetical protein
MKAYQLKIVIKNSKPSIWRRCIVPAGITFSQFSIILNKIMGWSSYHLSEFEFYHLELQLREEDEFDDFIPYGDFDLLDSSKTFINEYMEQQEWFTYTYDFGDDWQHRVTVEKVIADYPYNYPQVIKYKGDCPMEDCGGIEGYYECQNVMDEDGNPEGKARREWAESQGYGYAYDMNEVNADLQITCFVTLGKGDIRKQKEIYENMSRGQYGLIGSKKARNKEQPIKSERHKADYTMMQMAEMIKKLAQNKALQEKIEQIKEFNSDEQLTDGAIRLEAKKYIENMLSRNGNPKRIRLVNILNSYSKEDLKDIAKDYDLRKVSSLKKAELIDAIEEKMLMPETVRDAFVVLRDDEIHAFERVAEYEAGYPMKKNEDTMYENLMNLGYIGVREDNTVDVPDDVIEVYNKVNTEEFQNLRKRISWLVSCFDMATWFYGAVPVEIMIKVFRQRKGLKTDKQTLLSDYENIPQHQKDFYLLNDQFVHKNLLRIKDNYKNLMQCQGNKDYYIPTENEIVDITVNGFVLNDPDVKKLIQYFVHHLNIPEEEAKATAGMLQHEINGGCSMQDIFDIINDMGICFKSEDDFNTFMPIINNVWNNTRMLLNKGYKPNELFEEEKKHLRPLGQGNMPTIIPGSSVAAKLLMEGRTEIEKMGFPIDFDTNATEVPVYSMPAGINGSVEMKTKKIYPNDPCPCGSGKKYKKCCGR